MSSTYEIIYLPIRGRAEVLRIALAAANVSYKDTSIGGGDLPAFKATSLLGECTGLPVLRVTDAAGATHEIPQSYAILRFLAHAHGLIPSEPLLRARADVVAETHLDWRLGAFNPVAFKPGFLNDRAAVVAYFKDTVPKYLEVFERLLPADGPPRWCFLRVRPSASSLECDGAAAATLLGALPGLSSTALALHDLDAPARACGLRLVCKSYELDVLAASADEQRFWVRGVNALAVGSKHAALLALAKRFHPDAADGEGELAPP